MVKQGKLMMNPGILLIGTSLARILEKIGPIWWPDPTSHKTTNQQRWPLGLFRQIFSLRRGWACNRHASPCLDRMMGFFAWLKCWGCFLPINMDCVNQYGWEGSNSMPKLQPGMLIKQGDIGVPFIQPKLPKCWLNPYHWKWCDFHQRIVSWLFVCQQLKGERSSHNKKMCVYLPMM